MAKKKKNDDYDRGPTWDGYYERKTKTRREYEENIKKKHKKTKEDYEDENERDS